MWKLVEESQSEPKDNVSGHYVVYCLLCLTAIAINNISLFVNSCVCLFRMRSLSTLEPVDD